MKALLLCGLLLLAPVDPTPAPTPPPTDAEEYLDAVDLSPWDDLFSSMEGTEGWQRPSTLIREMAEGESDPARLLLWLKGKGLGGLSGAAALCLLALVTGALGALFETLLDSPILPARRVLSVGDRKSTRLNSSHPTTSRMPSSA